MRYVYNSSRDKHGKKYLKYLRFFLCNFPYSEYKGVIHRDNCTKIKLYNDIEKTLFLVGTLWIPGKQWKHHIVKGMLLFLDKMQGKNVLLWVYVD